MNLLMNQSSKFIAANEAELGGPHDVSGPNRSYKRYAIWHPWIPESRNTHLKIRDPSLGFVNQSALSKLRY